MAILKEIQHSSDSDRESQDQDASDEIFEFEDEIGQRNGGDADEVSESAEEMKPIEGEEEAKADLNNIAEAIDYECLVIPSQEEEAKLESSNTIQASNDDCPVILSHEEEAKLELSNTIQAINDDCPIILSHEEEAKLDSNDIIQAINDDCPIPSPVLKAIPSNDLSTAIMLLGNKYNSLVKTHQDQSSEHEMLKIECESLRKKCIEECEPKYETLMKKYTEERSERKRLYNEIIELKGNIRVFCRCRPLSSEEMSKGYTCVVDIDPAKESELQITCADLSKKHFKFNHVFGSKDDQESVFAETLPVVRSVLDGYNVCIFAYGQTGTGKTFTMQGTPENRGVNYRALEELFRSSEDRCSSFKYEFYGSMLEVYNEKIRDLLGDSSDQIPKRLEIKQGADGSQEVPGLFEARVCSIAEVWEMLKAGGRNRSIGSTNANEQSSRSHCLVRITIKSENLVDGNKSKSYLWLVDLAGSERVGKTEVEGERLKESQFINKSLSALGDVISALASKNPHIPYRNSKLTHLLQSSLGGDCKTLMFAQISPSSADIGETLCTLNFATRVQGVEHGPARKQVDPSENFKIKQMAEKLRQEEKEVARLSESLQLMQLKYASRENVFKQLQEKIREGDQTCRSYQQKVRDLESQLTEVKKSTRDGNKLTKPPLAPIVERQPLGKITNRLQLSAPQRIHISESLKQNKENVHEVNCSSETDLFRPKARRITLAPVPTRRRASVACVPDSTGRQLSLPDRQMVAQNQLSTARLKIRRRNSVSALTFPATPLTTPTPQSRTEFKFLASGSKFSSPPRMQALWKAKFAPKVSSPRHKLRLISSPMTHSNISSEQQSTSKLCLSVRKKVIVSSPAQSRPSLLPGWTRDQGLVGRLGTAQRVAVRNRRNSVI